MACTLLSLSYAPDEQALQHPNYEYLQWYFPYSFFKALLINEGESGRNDPVPKESGWINPTVGGHY